MNASFVLMENPTQYSLRVATDAVARRAPIWWCSTNWAEANAAQGLLECLGGDKVSLLDVPTHYPEYYWNLKYGLHEKGVSLSDYLEQHLRVPQKKEVI